MASTQTAVPSPLTSPRRTTGGLAPVVSKMTLGIKLDLEIVGPFERMNGAKRQKCLQLEDDEMDKLREEIDALIADRLNARGGGEYLSRMDDTTPKIARIPADSLVANTDEHSKDNRHAMGDGGDINGGFGSAGGTLRGENYSPEGDINASDTGSVADDEEECDEEEYGEEEYDEEEYDEALLCLLQERRIAEFYDYNSIPTLTFCAIIILAIIVHSIIQIIHGSIGARNLGLDPDYMLNNPQ
ncbi:hypothetical protein AA313_de0210471 [Arthrobotrys entomopaga]|nr:hypothetical protein AA313_de0210471 [Arthrobotrys entomopaga]